VTDDNLLPFTLPAASTRYAQGWSRLLDLRSEPADAAAEFDLPFRWFVGLGVDDPVLGSFGFLEEPRPALSGGVALKFLNAILKQPRVKRLLSTDHFSIDGWLKPGLR